MVLNLELVTIAKLKSDCQINAMHIISFKLGLNNNFNQNILNVQYAKFEDTKRQQKSYITLENDQ